MKRLVLLLLFLFLLDALVGVTWFRSRAGQREQDHYLEYAHAIKMGTFDNLAHDDKRLFPGLAWFLREPELAYLLIWGATIGSVVLLYKLTGSYQSLVVVLFPPVMLSAGTIIGTEMPTVFWLLLSLWFYKKKQYWLAATALGVGTWFRLIVVVAALVTVARLLYRKLYKDALIYGYIYFIAVMALILWNLFVFGDLLVQFRGYMDYARPVLGVWQLILDIPRALAWGWWRQVVSGISYLILLGGWLWIALGGKVGKTGEVQAIARWMVIGMVGFVFILGPTPFLEEFPRFLVPVFPLLWLLTYTQIKGKWIWLLPVISIMVVLL